MIATGAHPTSNFNYEPKVLLAPHNLWYHSQQNQTRGMLYHHILPRKWHHTNHSYKSSKTIGYTASFKQKQKKKKFIKM